MNRKIIPKGRNIFFLIALTAIIFSSCKTTRDITAEELRPLSVNRLMRRVERAAPDYDNFESKRIAVIYDDSGERNSFTAQLVLERDESLLLTIRKLNIPLGRGLLTPDSILLINYYDKNFIRDDISAMTHLIGMDLGFDLLQALITADVSQFVESDIIDKNLISEVDRGMYRINSQYSKRIDKAISEGNQRRLARYMQRFYDSEFINYSVWIDPYNYVIREILLHNMKLNETVTVKYDEYEKVGKNLFPHSISFNLNNDKQTLNVEMSLSRTSVNKSNPPAVVVPEQYKQYHIRK